MAITDQPLTPESAARDGVATTESSPTTTLPPLRGGQASGPARRALAPVHAVDVLAVLGGLAGGLGTTALLWAELSPFTGLLGYIVVSWVLFVLYYALLVSFDQKGTAVRDRVAAVVVWSLAVLVAGAIVWIVGYTVFRGLPALRHLNFYTQDMSSTGPLDPLTKGGVLHAMVGTLIEVGIAMVIAVPLGLLAAVFLNEVPGPLSRVVRTFVDAMTALPDILAGLFIYATLILILGLPLSGFAASCALAFTIISIICRGSYVVLRLVPAGLTEASYALGSGHWRTVRHVTLPTARSALMTAISLGMARAIGETAPVLLTSGATSFLNFNPLRSPMNSLPLYAFTFSSYSQAAMIERGFGAAAVLMVLFVVLVVLMRMLGGRAPGDLTPGQLRRRLAASRRDLARISNQAVAAQAAAGAAGFAPADDPSRWLLPGNWRPGRRS